jgi:hypothetical protein
MSVIKDNYPKLIPKYQEIRKDRTDWDIIETEIR